MLIKKENQMSHDKYRAFEGFTTDELLDAVMFHLLRKHLGVKKVTDDVKRTFISNWKAGHAKDLRNKVCDILIRDRIALVKLSPTERRAQ
jgi:hypothetical protein